MRRHRGGAASLAAALALTLAGPARAQEGATEAWEGSTRLRASLSSGYLGGYGIRPEGLGLVQARLRAEPRFQNGLFRLQLPFSVEHRQTFGGSLSELDARGGFDLRYRPDRRVRAGLQASVKGVLRPGWSDLYQPNAGQSLDPTSRFSYWGPKLRARVAGSPAKRHSLKAAVSFELLDYHNDPAYSPAAPTHLVPGDRIRLALDAGWHVRRRRHRAGLEFGLSSTRFGYAYARDAGTGRTHAGPGGPPPNPKQHFVGLEPSVNYRWKRKAGWLRRVELRYLHRVQVDTYEGYYSFMAPSPGLTVRLKPLRWLRLALELEGELRRYGAGSYAAGGSHPALETGDRRVSNSMTAKLGLDARLRKGLYFTLDARFDHRRTNFPDYLPGVYPATRDYSVNWDYDTVWIFAGVRWGKRFQHARAPAPSVPL